MIVGIGSYVLKAYAPERKIDEKLTDSDYIATEEGAFEWIKQIMRRNKEIKIETQEFPLYHVLYDDAIREDIQGWKHLDSKKGMQMYQKLGSVGSIKKLHGHTENFKFEIEIAAPGSSAESFLKLASQRPLMKHDGSQDCRGSYLLADLPLLEVVQTACAPFPSNFRKHIADLHLIRDKLGRSEDHYHAPKRAQELEDWIILRRIEHYLMFGVPGFHIHLNKTNEDFLDNEQNVLVDRYIKHDQIHEYVMLDKTLGPAFDNLRPDKSKAYVSKKLFDQAPDEVRKNCVREEAMVIALERYLLPRREKDPYMAYMKAYFRIATTLTRGFFREYAINVFPFVSKVEKDLLQIRDQILERYNQEKGEEEQKGSGRRRVTCFVDDSQDVPEFVEKEDVRGKTKESSVPIRSDPVHEGRGNSKETSKSAKRIAFSTKKRVKRWRKRQISCSSTMVLPLDQKEQVQKTQPMSNPENQPVQESHSQSTRETKQDQQLQPQGETLDRTEQNRESQAQSKTIHQRHTFTNDREKDEEDEEKTESDEEDSDDECDSNEYRRLDSYREESLHESLSYFFKDPTDLELARSMVSTLHQNKYGHYFCKFPFSIKGKQKFDFCFDAEACDDYAYGGWCENYILWYGYVVAMTAEEYDPGAFRMTYSYIEQNKYHGRFGRQVRLAFSMQELDDISYRDSCSLYWPYNSNLEDLVELADDPRITDDFLRRLILCVTCPPSLPSGGQRAMPSSKLHYFYELWKWEEPESESS